MSYSREDALRAAMRFISHIRNECDRVDIVGSVRRLKPEVNDIEILCQTRVIHIPDMFGDPTTTEVCVIEHLNGLTYFDADPEIEEWVDPDTGKKKMGDKYRRYVVEGIPLDLFIVYPDTHQQYGALQAIRTGPADFIKKIVTPRAQGGHMPPWLRQRDGALERLVGETPFTPDGYWERIDDIEDDIDWFDEIGVPLIPAHQRTVEALEKAVKRGRHEAAI